MSKNKKNTQNDYFIGEKKSEPISKKKIKRISIL